MATSAIAPENMGFVASMLFGGSGDAQRVILGQKHKLHIIVILGQKHILYIRVILGQKHVFLKAGPVDRSRPREKKSTRAPEAEVVGHARHARKNREKKNRNKKKNKKRNKSTRARLRPR